MPASRAARMTATPRSRGIRSNVRHEPSASGVTWRSERPSGRRCMPGFYQACPGPRLTPARAALAGAGRLAQLAEVLLDRPRRRRQPLEQVRLVVVDDALEPGDDAGDRAGHQRRHDDLLQVVLDRLGGVERLE